MKNPGAIWIMLLLLGPLAGVAGVAPAPHISLQVLDTDPARQSSLHYDETFYLRIAYQTDQPIRIFARPYYAGAPATTSTGPSSHPGQLLAAGSGETLGWFAYQGYANVDEVRITAQLEGVREPVASIFVPVRLYWDDMEPVTPRPVPAWVTSLNAAQQQAVAMPSEYDSGGLWLGQIILLAMFAVIILALGWPIWGWLKWQGGWKLLAGVPLAVFAAWILFIAIGVAADPTSHNLWPFELLLLAGGTLPYMLVLAILRRIQRNRDA